MEVAGRIERLATIAENLKKHGPRRFSEDPVSNLIDALVLELRSIAKQATDDDK